MVEVTERNPDVVKIDTMLTVMFGEIERLRVAHHSTLETIKIYDKMIAASLDIFTGMVDQKSGFDWMTRRRAADGLKLIGDLAKQLPRT